MEILDEAGPSTPPISTLVQLQSSMDYLMVEVHELRRETSETRRGQQVLLLESRPQARHRDHMAQQMTSFRLYSIEFNTSLVQAFASCSITLGPSPIQFLAPPMMSHYDSEDDEDEDA